MTEWLLILWLLGGRDTAMSAIPVSTKAECERLAPIVIARMEVRRNSLTWLQRAGVRVEGRECLKVSP